MKATLYLNGLDQPYPDDIPDLEALIVHIMKRDGGEEEIIVNVKVDGAGYSETYDHQARDVDLKTIETVHLSTVSTEWFSSQFITQISAYIDHLKKGFKNSIRLLRDNGKEKNGFAMLAKSMDTLSALKNHLKNVRGVIDKTDDETSNTGIWQRFEAIFQLMDQANEKQNPMRIADLLEAEVLPFLEDWKEAA